MPWMAASTANSFMRMKSVSVLSRSKKIARITAALHHRRRLRRASAIAAKAATGAAWGWERSELLGGRADHPTETDLAIVDADIEAAARIGAHPGLVGNARPFTTVVRERNQYPRPALHALREPHLLHE